ncbi:hypothetical protein ACFQ3C_06785 [Seohaeicola saemankumensis]|uniref:Uncharacterized protein n=1 Tax=Seohaeicola saemankumensis TaxID=481181 RepID=A0ABW3TB04_9RHOB
MTDFCNGPLPRPEARERLVATAAFVIQLSMELDHAATRGHAEQETAEDY